MLVPSCCRERCRRGPGCPGRPDRGCRGLLGSGCSPCSHAWLFFSWGFSAEKPVQLPSCAGAWLDLSRAGVWMDFVPQCAAPPTFPCPCGCSLLRAAGLRVRGGPGVQPPPPKRCCWVLPCASVCWRVWGHSRPQAGGNVPLCHRFLGQRGEPGACRRSRAIMVRAPPAAVPQFPHRAH